MVAGLTLIAAAQTDQGCWCSMGGTRSVARALERIIREHETDGRATVITGQGVSRITATGGKANPAAVNDILKAKLGIEE